MPAYQETQFGLLPELLSLRASESPFARGSRRCGVPRPGLLPRVSSTRVPRRGLGNY